MEAQRKKLSIHIQRHRRILSTLGYIGMLGVSALLLWDPSFVDYVIPFSTDPHNDMREMYVVTTPDPGPPTRSVPRKMGFDFIPKNFSCEAIFHDSGHGYKYPDSYWDHVDAFKGALEMHGLIQEGVANEESWVITEIGELKFVRNICETGFGAGHFTFHWLVAQEESVVFSFGRSADPMEIEMQDFMAIEFPDRFYGIPGPSRDAVANWVKQEVNKTTCDAFFIGTNESTAVVRENVRNLHKVANMFENVVIFDSHPQNSSTGATVWAEMLANGVIEEHFRCYVNKHDDSGTQTNQRGLMVGSFTQKNV